MNLFCCLFKYSGVVICSRVCIVDWKTFKIENVSIPNMFHIIGLGFFIVARNLYEMNIIVEFLYINKTGAHHN